MKSVAVIDTDKRPQDPAHPAVARKMLKAGQVAVYGYKPFTLILRQPAPRGGQQLALFALAAEAMDAVIATLTSATPPAPLRLKIDPGSSTTGLEVVNDETREIIWVGEINHRGHEIKDALDSRRAVRRRRRNANLRYRQPRFLNRNPGACQSCGGNRQSGKRLCRPCAGIGRKNRDGIRASRRADGEVQVKRLPPSIMSRIHNLETWVRRIKAVFPIAAISFEVVKFDMQLMDNPDIAGVEYQHGTLAGYERKEYLLEKFERTCVYCKKGAKTGDKLPLEVEHLTPSSRGGTDRIGNLAIARRPCNQAKGNQTAEEFGHPGVRAKAKQPLRYAAMMNAARYATRDMLRSFGLPLELGSGGLTKFNRTRAGLDKSHWADAACVGVSTPEWWRTPRGGGDYVHVMTARSYPPGKAPRRRVMAVCAVGFPQPCGHKGKKCTPMSSKRKKSARLHFGYQWGDVVDVVMRKGRKWRGKYRGAIGTKARGDFRFLDSAATHPKDFSYKNITRIIYRDGSFRHTMRPL